MTAYFYQGLPIVAPFTIESNEPMYVSNTYSLRQSVAKHGTQRFELSFKIQATGAGGSWFARVLKNLGSVSTMTMPQDWYSEQVTSVNTDLTPSVSTATIAGRDTVPIAAMASFTGVLAAGYFVTFSNHPKLYMITADATFNGSARNITIYPDLQSPLPAGTRLQLGANTAFTYRNDLSTPPTLTFSDGLMHEVGPIKLIEAI